eukprot:TRINITY_DN1867_c0_g1_i4.p1 TRINITY_DN1867_c0_g1~~TRINITY_DN1867_c0_g1_i4.p1  ORF type:complete len:657 (+),score=80.40 TRINITY_DN1867_c0_g1_i4:260-2230(+)
MKKTPFFRCSLFLLLLSLSTKPTQADPRSQTIEIRCSTQLEHNATIFVPNFVATMENISSEIRTAGFGTSVVGSGPDRSYGLAQCYGDLSSLDCVLCYAEARTILPQCYPNNGGSIFLDGCFMRSQNYSFFEEIAGPRDHAVCGNKTRKGSSFEASARRAVLEASTAAPGNAGYARSSVSSAGSNESAYVLANCWKTLNSSSCQGCLENASASVLECLPWSEGRALNTGCFLRYSERDFLNPEQRNESSRGNIILIVVTSVSSVGILVVGMAIGICICKRQRIQKKRKGLNDSPKMASTLYHSSLNFKFSTLEKATGSFDIANKLGQGGFGTVYRGILADGREVAVKRLFVNNRHRATNFYNEVNMISSIEHKNLVRLLGCSCEGPESLLVYELIENKSLDRFLFDQNRGKALNWEKRFEIIVGTAEGLVYLHENSNIRIIHRDIKASNILLDSKLRAKIADFGLARSFQEDKSHISTAIAGTLGYMAPEYLAHGQLTEKADVYSFGVLLLEIVSGRQNNRSKDSDFSDSLVTAAWKHFLAGTCDELIDPNLNLGNYDNDNDNDNNIDDNIKSEILKVVHVGLLCTQEIAVLRPSMSKALQMLTKKDKQLPEPTKPPFTDERTMAFNDTCEDPGCPLNANTVPSVATVSHSAFHPR